MILSSQWNFVSRNVSTRKCVSTCTRFQLCTQFPYAALCDRDLNGNEPRNRKWKNGLVRKRRKNVAARCCGFFANGEVGDQLRGGVFYQRRWKSWLRFSLCAARYLEFCGNTLNSTSSVSHELLSSSFRRDIVYAPETFDFSTSDTFWALKAGLATILSNAKFIVRWTCRGNTATLDIK